MFGLAGRDQRRWRGLRHDTRASNLTNLHAHNFCLIAAKLSHKARLHLRRITKSFAYDLVTCRVVRKISPSHDSRFWPGGGINKPWSCRSHRQWRIRATQLRPEPRPLLVYTFSRPKSLLRSRTILFMRYSELGCCLSGTLNVSLT